MYDVSSNLTHPEWTTRIACCLALRDLIRRPTGLRLRTSDTKMAGGSGNVKMDVDGNNWWCSRVRNQEDEGTREAAEGTANILAKICVVSVSCGHG